MKYTQFFTLAGAPLSCGHSIGARARGCTILPEFIGSFPAKLMQSHF